MTQPPRPARTDDRLDGPEGRAASDDDGLFQVLDSYVEALHRADRDASAHLSGAHPGLADLLQCLDALESIAPDASPESDPFDDPDAVTLGVGAEPGAGDELVGRGAHPVRIETRGKHVRVEEYDPDCGLPRRFGKYELREEIGRGGMGVVFRAWQTDLQRTVAVKMILSSRLAGADDVRRFYAEARSAGSLRHPHVVGIHEVGEVGGQHYFAMDLVEGRSLAARLRSEPFAVDEAARLLAVVARAVQHLHEHGIVHRDLKPSNILLDESGAPFVTDFGLAKTAAGDSRETRSGTIVGTPSYMPPEQAAGRVHDVSPRSDVYSLGAIFYELLVGQPPFEAETPLDTVLLVLEGEPVPPRRIDARLPVELETICLRCLEKDPARRYASAGDLADDLERWLRGEGIDARPPHFPQRLRRWVRRHPSFAAHLGALLAAMVIVQMSSLWRPANPRLHLQVMSVLGLWLAASAGFHALAQSMRFRDAAQFGWAAADVLLLTWQLFLAEAGSGPLLIGYPMLVVAAGLLFRERFVWFTTGVSLVSYGALVATGAGSDQPGHYPLLFAVILALLGFGTGFQVRRIRTLSRHFDPDRR